jgi:F-type H+-transporting ATPase subunit alpha
MASFAQFASDLDAATQRLLARGERLTELLKQNQFSPLSVTEQVLAIFTGVRGYLDKIPVQDIGRFEKEFLGAIQSKKPELAQEILDTKKLSEAGEQELATFLDEFVKVFA